MIRPPPRHRGASSCAPRPWSPCLRERGEPGCRSSSLSCGCSELRWPLVATAPCCSPEVACRCVGWTCSATNCSHASTPCCSTISVEEATSACLASNMVRCSGRPGTDARPSCLQHWMRVSWQSAGGRTRKPSRSTTSRLMKRCWLTNSTSGLGHLSRVVNGGRQRTLSGRRSATRAYATLGPSRRGFPRRHGGHGLSGAFCSVGR
mmetsp:Transcript_18785/g.51765  ORF Transcript_18785/g.51765 Transcript_18785/m.51765 type:complete len:206 (-) Transcript_18785:35-652(-)